MIWSRPRKQRRRIAWSRSRTFPTTEYLQPRDIDFVCFNVYLHDEQVFRNYLSRLQNIAGEKPLMLGEYGIDTLREHTEEQQAEILANHVRAVFDEGLAGTFIFSFTDDWFTHGWRIEDWAFGIVRRDRTPKPAFARRQGAVRAGAAGDRRQAAEDQRDHLLVQRRQHGGIVPALDAAASGIPDFEVIFVDDGSTDSTQEILEKFPWVRNIQQKNMGLSYARNVGMDAATRRDHRLYRQRLRGG